MRVALVHDYLKEVGGAERVLMALKEIWPEAPVYTAYKFPQFWGQFREKLGSWDIRESWGSWLPFLPRWLSYYTVLSPLFFSEMDLSEYEVVIVSATGAYFPNAVRVGEETKLITYCHTPPRFLYGYETATRERYKWYWRPISEAANHWLRMVDYRLAQRPGVWVANSKNVAGRVRKFYRREAEVVYPPIEVGGKRVKEKEREDYYLMVTRIVGTKNVELAVAAANKYKFKLKIAGKPIGRSGAEIVKKIEGETVEYLGEVSEEEKEKLLAKARGFLALEKEADFGMTTVEPMVYGTPVVAFRGGGYLETVEEGKTGVFFERLELEGVGEAVARFERIKWEREAIKKTAMKYAKEEFKKKMLEIVEGEVN